MPSGLSLNYVLFKSHELPFNDFLFSTILDLTVTKRFISSTHQFVKLELTIVLRPWSKWVPSLRSPIVS